MLEKQSDFIRAPLSNVPPPDELRQALPYHIHGCGRFYTADKYYTKRDGLRNYLLLYTTDGCGQMHYQGKTCLLKPGSAVVIDCSAYQEYNTLPGSIWNFYYLHFNALSMEGFRGLLLDQLTPIPLRSPQEGERMMRKLYQLSFLATTASYIQQSNLISNLLTEMVCSLEDQTSSHLPNRKDIADLAEYIRTHFQQELHIDDFMELTNLSRHYLIHTFEKQIGMSPYRYLHLCRVKHAQILLKTTDMTVTQIAENVGYHSAAIFIRRFKAFLGTTPTAYRGQATPQE